MVEDEAAPKILKAGASAIVNPTMIGARRMASELIRPEVNEFLDQMLRDKDRNLRLEEVPIGGSSTFVGLALKDALIRTSTGSLVVAIRRPDRTFVYNPDPELLMEAGTTLIVLGESQGIAKLRAMVLS